MRAVVKEFHSPDIALGQAVPDSDSFGILVQAMVGPADSDGEESFSILVCTPEWIREEVARHGFVVGRGLLIVESFDWRRISAFLRKVLELDGETWAEIALKVSRVGTWDLRTTRRRCPWRCQ
jgi:hypothetical protein